MTQELELMLLRMYKDGWFFVIPLDCNKWYANYQKLVDMRLAKKKLISRGGRFLRESLTAKGIRKAISIENKKHKNE
jgi:hypothetical protein